MHALEMSVRLGWSEEERALPQSALVDVEIRFARLPRACLSDELEGTVCYGHLSRRIREVCEARPYKLVEHLGHEIFRALKKEIGAEQLLRVTIKKVRTPIPELSGGASFTCDDFQASAP